jgi:hypothetical protein
MGINLKTISMLGIALILLFSCKPTRYTRQKTGKSIPVKLQYKTPFKLGDTLYLSFKCSVTDLVDDYNSRVGDFKSYIMDASPSVRKKDTIIVPNDGKYVKIISDIPNSALMQYNPVTGDFECKYGYIPFKKGIYQVQNSSITVIPPSSKYASWNLPMYYEGDSPATSDRYKYFEVE